MREKNFTSESVQKSIESCAFCCKWKSISTPLVVDLRKYWIGSDHRLSLVLFLCNFLFSFFFFLIQFYCNWRICKISSKYFERGKKFQYKMFRLSFIFPSSLYFCVQLVVQLVSWLSFSAINDCASHSISFFFFAVFVVQVDFFDLIVAFYAVATRSVCV